MHLYQVLAQRVAGWREQGYPHNDYPAIAEILEWAANPEDGRVLILEIKNAQFEAATREDLRRAEAGQAAITVEGRKAVALKQWEALNADRLKYELVFAREDTVGYDQLRPIRRFVEGSVDDGS